jgi:hypothetical protein
MEKKRMEIMVIHIVWERPLTPDKAANKNTDDNYGVYQIYGTHAVTGPNTLLYVGRANGTRLGDRIAAAESAWGRWEPKQIEVYLGRIAGLEPTTDETWSELIDRAAAILIFKVGLPYNSAGIASLPPRFQDKPTLVVNHGRRNRLPERLSTITEFVNTDTRDFKKFGYSPLDHHTPPPIPSPGALPDEEERKKK